MDMETNDDANTNSQYHRTSEDIKSMIKLAKLNEKHLTEVTQVIYYSDKETSAADWKLLELNTHLLSAIEGGETLFFKGGLNEKVVLCTDDRTYDVKEAGISNSLLLIPDLKLSQATSKSPIKSPKSRGNTSTEGKQNESTESIEDDDFDPNCERPSECRHVEKVFHEYFECREIKPKFRKLGELLHLTQYSGPENEYCIDRSLLFTYQQLLDTTQCSRLEFEMGLKTYRTFEFESRVRVFDVEYEYRLLSLLLGIITENSWKIDEIDRSESLSAISETIAPAAILEAVFDLYTHPSTEASSSNKILFTYNEELVCRTIALHILQQGTKFHYEDFMETWQNAVPDGFMIQEKYLRGIGIIDRTVANVPCIRTLIEHNLTVNLIDRLKILFKTCERWTVEQISSYIEFFATPQLTISSILAKHARAITENGQRIYVSKHRV